MAEAEAAGDNDGLLETHSYSAVSYNRLKSNEGEIGLGCFGVVCY